MQGIDYVSADSLYLISAWHHFVNHQTQGNNIQDLVVKNNRIYLATGYGIFIYDLNFQNPVSYTTSNGLISDKINTIAVDDNNNIFFSYGFWNKEELIINNSQVDYSLGKILPSGKIEYLNKDKSNIIFNPI